MKMFGVAALAAGLMAAGAVSASTFVAANLSGTTDLGAFAAGFYNISATGISDLVGGVGSGFDINPDGTPTSMVTTPGYGYFNPTGSYTADGNFGPGGSVIKIGGLMGSFVPVGPLGNFAPPNPNFFLIGNGTTVHLLSAGHLYAQVNDTYYSNNGGGFDVSVSGVGVPEPAVWAMMLAGFGLTGLTLRRRRPAPIAA
jgi:hypothetical protein